MQTDSETGPETRAMDPKTVLDMERNLEIGLALKMVLKLAYVKGIRRAQAVWQPAIAPASVAGNGLRSIGSRTIDPDQFRFGKMVLEHSTEMTNFPNERSAGENPQLEESNAVYTNMRSQLQ